MRMVGVSSDPSPQASTLVGRAGELGELMRLVGLTGAATDRPATGGAVLLGGDAGVGKTRLLTELGAMARDRGWYVLVGHCLNFAGDSLPYVPFSEVFGAIMRDAPVLGGTLLQQAPALARLLPGRRVLSDAGDDSGDRQGAYSREELFEAVLGALELVARGAPVLLVVEDVHWADPSTRDLLRFIFTRRLPAAAAVVVSYRADDLHRRHPLRADAAEWARLPGVTRLMLAPLGEEAVRAMVHELQPAGLPETAVSSIVSRAEGNAFFVEELVVAARRGQPVLSADLADLLLVHLDAADADSRTTLRAISVAGRSVTHTLLERVVERSGLELDLDRALRTAIDRSLLVARAEGYAFRHALLAEAVYDDLLPGERTRWHQAYADVLGSGAGDGTAAELARHALAANDATTALRAAIRAGDEAMTVGGPAEALTHYEMALGLLARPGAPSPDGQAAVDGIELALRANEAAIAAGQLHRALGLLEETLAQLPADTDPERRATLLTAVANTAMLDDSPIDALALTTEALLLAPAETPLRARVLAAHARANRVRGREEDAWRWATEAAELAERLQLPAVLSDATTTLGRLTPDLQPEQALSAEAAFRASLAQAREGADIAAELRSAHGLGILYYEVGRLEEAKQCFLQAAERAGHMRRPWAPYGLDGRLMAALVGYIRGNWDEALHLTDVSREGPPALAWSALRGVALGVEAGRGEAAELERLPELRAAWERDGFIAVTCGSAAIDLAGHAGDCARAVAVHDEVVELVSRLWENPIFQARLRLSGLMLGQLAAAARRAGSAERRGLLDRGDELRTVAEAVGARAVRRGPESQAWLARVRAEHGRLTALGDGTPAPPHEQVEAWTEAVAAFDRFGHVFEAARSRARLASALRAAGQVKRAEEEVALALPVARALGARPLLVELRGSGPTGTAAEAGPADLTAREHEVLTLVAQGRSNRQIAEQLFISAKTVSVHMSNILAKLEAVSRTEAVAVARRKGVLQGLL